jgi:hypothetical protein
MGVNSQIEVGVSWNAEQPDRRSGASKVAGAVDVHMQIRGFLCGLFVKPSMTRWSRT